MKSRTRNYSAATVTLPATLTLLLLAVVTQPGHIVDGLRSEELKPCFERYDGHKLFGATPFHSEWRMKREVDCLSFCIRASSRCSSIVYDKLSHICYYFTVNGIAVESIERNSRMVYLQVAERRCVDEMLMIMDAEEREQPQQMYVVVDERSATSQYSSTAAAPPRQPQFYVHKDDYGKKIVAAHVGVDAANESTAATALPDDVTSAVTTSGAVEFTSSAAPAENAVGFSSSASPEVVNYGRSPVEESSLWVSSNVGYNQLPVIDSEIGVTQMSVGRPEEVVQQLLASEAPPKLPEVVPLAEKTTRVSDDGTAGGPPDTVEPSSITTTSSPTTTPPPATVPHLLVPPTGLDALAMPALLPVMNVFKATRRDSAAPSAAFGDARPPGGVDQPRFVGSGPLPPAVSADDLEEQLWRSFHVSNDVRRHPQHHELSSSTSGEYPPPERVIITTTTVLPAVVSASKTRSAADDASTSRHVVDQNFDDAFSPAIDAISDVKPTAGSSAPPSNQPPQVERLPSTSSEESNGNDGSEELAFELDGVDQACSGSGGEVNQVWLAVENAQFRGSLAKSVRRRIEKFNRKSVSPKECMNECSAKTVERRSGASLRACDSFTYFESTRHCVFDAVGSALPRAMIASAAPGHESDFTLRAFHRLCYSSNLTPFANCAEFLAFRDYTLDIEPHESFTGLPTGRDGISACVELCVLSSEFLCRSAQFDWSAGACQLFDEHSLSMPSAFREHHLADRLYFENGCADGEVPQEIKEVRAAAAHRLSRKSVVLTPTAKRMTRRHVVVGGGRGE